MSVVIIEKRDRIAFITLNRPEAMNALSSELNEALEEAWLAVRDDPDIWCAIVTGAGDRAFSAGADLKEMSQRRAGGEAGRERRAGSKTFGGLMDGIMVWKPVIAAVNGYCLAGGLELALACDIRIAASHASFGLSEVLRAIIPGAGGTQRLSRYIPFGVALEILLTGQRIDAEQAYRLGLVNRVVPLPELMPAAEALARRINENGPLAVRAIKEAAYRGRDLPLREGLRLEGLFSQLIHYTEDSKEGPLAFAEKRRPVYKGK